MDAEGGDEFQEVDELDEFFVFEVAFPGGDDDAVVGLESGGGGFGVYHDDFRDIAIKVVKVLVVGE